MGELRISSPWVTYYRKIKALFGKDPQIKITYDNDAPEVKIFVENSEKAYAIAQLLPTVKSFGNVDLKVTVVPANVENHMQNLVETAFKGNPAFVEVVQTGGEGPYTFKATYALFKKEVVQYFNDDLSDAHGVTSTLYQEIAKELFETDDIYFCTATEGKSLGTPLGEWP